MSHVMRCDSCGKEEIAHSRFSAGGSWVSVEAEEDDDCFDACSWACVAAMALSKASEEVTG